MKLTFLGTRGHIEQSSPRHRRHSSLLIEREGQRIMIDCGLDWLGQLQEIAPQAILLTHAHDDHIGGLRYGAPCPVHATAETWERISSFPIADRQLIAAGKTLEIADIAFEAVPVDHSLRAPAVGYRIDDGTVNLFYLPDVASLPNPSQTLAGAQLYIGDGAAGSGSLLRVEQGQLCGHAPLATQLNWCRKAGVARMIVSHCGSELVARKRKAPLTSSPLSPPSSASPWRSPATGCSSPCPDTLITSSCDSAHRPAPRCG